MARCLVIGYGNPLRGDDGVGWRVANDVAASLADASVEALTVHQLTPELSASISRADRVIFVDAAATGAHGAILCWPLAETEPPAAAGGFDSHLASPDQLLVMAAELFGRRPEAHLMTIAGGVFALSEELSPPVAAAVAEAVARVVALATAP